MKKFQIEYIAENNYQGQVDEAFFEFRILPCHNEDQHVVEHTITNNQKLSVFSTLNSFGFQQHRLRCNSPFSHFKLDMKAEVEVAKRIEPNWYKLDPKLVFETLQERSFSIDYHLYLLKTGYTTIILEDKHLVPEYSEEIPLYDYAISLKKHVHDLIEFEVDSTTVHTTAHEVLMLKKGVCQDFAHLYLAMARQKNMACRYVSGYLNQGKGFLGAMAMHAWVEVWIPGAGWLGLDPTNNNIVDENYIKVCHGTDYNDCSPMRGVLKYNGKQQIDYSVKVFEQ